MFAFLVGVGFYAVGGGVVYAIIFALQILGSIVTPGESSAKSLAVAFIGLMLLPSCKFVGEGLIAERKHR